MGFKKKIRDSNHKLHELNIVWKQVKKIFKKIRIITTLNLNLVYKIIRVAGAKDCLKWTKLSRPCFRKNGEKDKNTREKIKLEIRTTRFQKLNKENARNYLKAGEW